MGPVRKGFYWKLAAGNIRKNRKIYYPYLLTAVLTAMMLYVISSLSSNQSLGSGNLLITLQLGKLVTTLFAVIFLFYTNSFLMKRRKKEFGLLNILGMGKKHIALVIFCETLILLLVSLVLALLPESWMEEYGKAMRLSTETGLIPALAVVAGAPLAEELVFRGVIQSRLERAMPVWIAIVLQAVLFGFIHGTPVQIGYAFLMGLLFGYIRYRTGSILPTIAAHAAFNAMNDPLGLLGGFAEKWQFLAVMAAVCAAGCVICRCGLSRLRTAPEAEARSTSPTVCEEITE